MNGKPPRPTAGTIIIPEEKESHKEEKVVIYCRVSSSENKPNLDSQAERLISYCYAKGYKVHRIVLSPTYTKDLAANMKQLIQTGKYGIYHITSHGECSWYDFAKVIFELTGLDVEFSPTTTEEFGAKAERPSYSVLDNNNLRLFGLDNMKSCKNALKEYLAEKGHI